MLPINSSPIVVLGNQKAGTSVIAHLLADRAGLSKTVDIPESWWPTLRSLLNEELSLQTFAKRNRHRFAVDVIKEPNLTFFYQELKSLHPDAKFVFVARDPRANIRSLLDRLDLPGDREDIESALKSVALEWRHLFNRDIWDLEHEHYVAMLAERWARAARIYLENQSEIYLIRYEDFLDNRVEAIDRLTNILDLEPVHDISDKVDVQYQPRGNRNVTWSEFFGAHNLHRIEQISRPEMVELCYATSTLTPET
jgi:hypothetical protein